MRVRLLRVIEMLTLTRLTKILGAAIDRDRYRDPDRDRLSD
jgi:hypothetical protein